MTGVLLDRLSGALVQGIATFVTLLPLTVPLALVTVQTCAGVLGWVTTVTVYVVPFACPLSNVTVPLAEIATSVEFTRTISPEPASPVTLPVIV